MAGKRGREARRPGKRVSAIADCAGCGPISALRTFSRNRQELVTSGAVRRPSVPFRPASAGVREPKGGSELHGSNVKASLFLKAARYFPFLFDIFIAILLSLLVIFVIILHYSQLTIPK